MIQVEGQITNIVSLAEGPVEVTLTLAIPHEDRARVCLALSEAMRIGSGLHLNVGERSASA